MMHCPNCGISLDNDSNYCIACGIQLDDSKNSESTDVDVKSEYDPITVSAETGTKRSNSICTSLFVGKIIGLIVGSLLILIGIISVFSSRAGVSSTSFGGDFYTYTYKGIVAIYEILASIDVMLGWILVALGTIVVILSLRNK